MFDPTFLTLLNLDEKLEKQKLYMKLFFVKIVYICICSDEVWSYMVTSVLLSERFLSLVQVWYNENAIQ